MKRVLTVKQIGRNEIAEQWETIQTVVKQEWDTLYEGATRLGHLANKPENFGMYIQSDTTYDIIILNKDDGFTTVGYTGIKNGEVHHEYFWLIKSPSPIHRRPSEKLIIKAIDYLQMLFDEASKDITLKRKLVVEVEQFADPEGCPRALGKVRVD